MGEPSEKDGSFSVPAEQPTRHFTDAEVRRNYEYILTSTNLYPPELHSAVRSVLSEPPLNPDWSDKGRQIAALFTPYGDREYQGDLLYRTRLHGEDGISFFFDEGYTYIPWNGLAFLLDAMIEDGDYPNPVVEEQPDPIGDYNIPDEVDEMGGPHRQMTIGEADFDYVLDAVAYEAGETVVEPVKPQAIVQMENDTPAAGDEPASVPDENPPVVVEAPETALPTDTAEQPTPPPVKGNTTAHKNFRRFQELFPEIVSGQYEYLRLEAGEAYYPLVIHHKYGSHYCMEHYYMQNGDRMYDPYMDFQIDKEAGTLRAFSYENSGIGVYNEADPDDPAYEKAINGFNSFFATWLNNIRSQGYEPVRASMMVNDEEVDVDLRPAVEAVPVVEEEQPEQLSLLSLEKSTEDLLVERVMQRGPLTAGKKEQIYEFAQTHPTGSEFTTFLKKLYGYEGFSGDEMGVKYAMFNSEGVTIEWQDEQGETQETKLSWARAAGVVQRLMDEGRYLETPVVSLPEPETDEPLEGETEPYDYSFEYGLLGRLKADCEYFLSEGHQHEKHYYYRFYNENGIELYTMEKKREFFQTVYIPCDGFMVGIDQRHRLEEVLKWLPTLEHGIRGEIERVFNQSMEAPDRWADLGFANLLGRYEEAKAHNAPIAAERQRQANERRAQQDAREQQLAQERQARYDSAIREAEGNIMVGKEVINREINGKSLIMQLFREHEIPVPLKTQGWIINSLHSIRYDPQIGEWNYRYFKGSRNSTKMFDLLSKLSAAIQTRQQFEEHGASPPDSPVLDCEEEQDMEL